MAGSIKGITIEIGGNTVGLTKALEEPNKQSRSLQNELKQVERLLKFDPKNTELLAQKQKLLADSVDATKKKLDALREAEKQAQGQLKSGKISEEQYRALQREIVKAEQDLEKLGDTAIESGKKAEKGGNGFSTLGKIAGGIGKTVAAVGAAGTAAAAGVGALALKSGAAADDLNTLSRQTGLTTADIQKFQYATDLIDVPLETLTKSMAKLTKNMQSANYGSKNTQAAFSELGISIKDNNGQLRDNQTVFNEAINALGKIENSTQRDALAMQIFGKSAQDLNPLILGGADALKQLGDEAEAAGLILSQDKIDRANEFNDAWDKLKATSKGTFQVLGAEIGGALLPQMQEATGEIMNMMGAVARAASNNGITGVLDEIGKLLGNLAGKIAAAAPKMISAGVGMIQSLLSGVQQSIPEIAQGAAGVVNALLTGLLQMLPQMLQIGMDLLAQLLIGLAQALPTLIPTIVDVLMQLIQTFYDNMPMIIDAGMQLLHGLVDGIINAIPVLVAALPGVINSMVNYLVESIPEIIQAGIDLLTSIVGALPEIISAIVEVLPEIIEGIVGGLLEAIPQIIQAGIDLLVSLIDALPEIIVTIVQALPEIIAGIVNGLLANIPALIMAGVQLFVAIVQNLPTIIIEICKAVPQIIDGLVVAFGDMVSKMWEVGKNLVSGIWDGIKKAKDWLLGKIKEWCGSILNGIKAFFGIHSPSRVMRDQVGKPIVEGVALGIKENSEKVSEEFKDMLEILKMQKDIGLVDDQQYYKELEKLRDKYLEKGTKDWWTYTTQIIKYEQSVLGEQKKTIVKTFQNLASETDKSVSEINKKIDSMKSKLDDYGTLYREVTIQSGAGEETFLTLNDFEEDIAALEAYQAALDAVISRGVPDGFFDLVADMSIEEGTQFAQLLARQTDADFDAYIQGWKKKQEISKDISSSLFKNQMNDIAHNTVAALNAAIEGVPEDFKDNGVLSAEKWGEGFNEEIGKVLDGIRKSISDVFTVPANALATSSMRSSGTSNNYDYRSFNASTNVYGSSLSPAQVTESNRRMLKSLALQGV